jgi:hypothetical protein
MYLQSSGLRADARRVVAELPESYYNPTAGQLRMAQAGQTNKLKSLGVDANFTTKKQRDQEAKEREEARIKRHPKVRLMLTKSSRSQLIEVADCHKDTLSRQTSGRNCLSLLRNYQVCLQLR